LNHDPQAAPGVQANYKAVYYLNPRGDNPVEAFIDGQDEVTQAAFFAYTELLKEYGPDLKRPYSDKVRGKIRELRPREIRVLYFFAGKRAVMLHGFPKKRDDLDEMDIDMAEKRMIDWLRTHGGGRS